MATVYPTSAGTWSTRTWNDDSTGLEYSLGTPQIDDTVKLNGLQITIDEDVSIEELNNLVGTNAVVGGQILITSDSNGYSFSANTITNGPTIGFFLCDLPANSTFTINGNLTGGTANFSHAVAVVSTSVGTLTINGDLRGGNLTLTNGLNMAGGTVIVNGTTGGGDGQFARGSLVSGGTLILNGTVLGTGAPNSHGLLATNGIAYIERAQASLDRCPSFAGTVRFLDENAPNLITCFDANGVEHVFEKTQ